MKPPKGLFAVCRGKHTDPGYEFKDTIDGAVLDILHGKLFLYSVVYAEGKFSHLDAPMCMRLEELAAKVESSSEGLRTLFSLVERGGLTYVCSDDLDQKAMEKVVKQDLEPAPRNDRSWLLHNMQLCLPSMR